MRPDVFISYARTDIAICRSIAEFLGEQGLDVWWDSSLTNGQPFPQQLSDTIRASKAVLVIWTTASVNSDWVRKEALLALEGQKLAAIRIGAPEIPAEFASIHHHSFEQESIPWFSDGWLAVLDRLAELAEKPNLNRPLVRTAFDVSLFPPKVRAVIERARSAAGFSPLDRRDARGWTGEHNHVDVCDSQFSPSISHLPGGYGVDVRSDGTIFEGHLGYGYKSNVTFGVVWNKFGRAISVSAESEVKSDKELW